MALFTLTDLHQLYQIQQPFSSAIACESDFALDPVTPANFQLLMKQLFLGLPVQPLLDAHPQMASWVAEVKDLAPELFQPRKKLWIEMPVIAPLALGSEPTFIQVPVTLGFRRGVPRLYEWAVRQPAVSWQDRVKLWATTIRYALSPNQVQLVILAVHSTNAAQRLKLTWNVTLHQQTERSLIQLLTQPLDQPPNIPFIQSDIPELPTLAEIPEIAI